MSDSDVSPFFSRDRWSITAYYKLFPLLTASFVSVICTVTQAFLKHRYWHMYTHPHSISFCSWCIRAASSKTIKEAPSFFNARLQPKKNQSYMLDVAISSSNSSYWCVSSLKCFVCVHLFVREGCNVNVPSSCACCRSPWPVRNEVLEESDTDTAKDGSGKESKQERMRIKDTRWKMQVKRENVGRRVGRMPKVRKECGKERAVEKAE